MGTLNFHSLRFAHWFSCGAATIILLLLLAQLVLNSKREFADSQYHYAMQAQARFGQLLALEPEVAAGMSHYANFLAVSQNLQIDLLGTDPDYDITAIKEREYTFSRMLNILTGNEELFSSIDNTLPELVERVQSIHTYHVENIKLQQSRGQASLSSEGGVHFERSHDGAASELDILAAAISVQNCLLEVVSLFSELQKGAANDLIEQTFQQRMANFHASINLFEDYSLDAQDGLIVEELLISGKTFKEAFSNLLVNGRRVELLKNKLIENRDGLFVQLEAVAERRQEKSLFLSTLAAINLKLLMGSSILFLVWLLFLGVRLTRQFSLIASEASKIQSNLTHKVSPDIATFNEFSTIQEALNSLAETALAQVHSLENMQKELSRRVHERTSELVYMNTRLKNEIADRIKADETRKDLEARLIRAKKMEAIGTLAGGVAHDLNNILSGVVSYPELILLDMDKDDPLYTSILTIKNSGEKAASIVQDLLTLARRGVAISEVVNIGQLINDYFKSAEFITLRDQHPSVTVNAIISEKCGNIRGSRIHLQKSIMNLVANGMEAMPDGGELKISATTVYVDQLQDGFETIAEGDYVKISIADEGVGMSLEVSERIFEPFFSQKKMGRSGTGLGMAVVYSTVKDHGGYIDLDTQPGKGSTIQLFLPLTQESETSQPIPVNFDSLLGTAEHVLVVDDIFEQRQIAASILKRLNYTVATASSGEEAIAYVSDNEVDLVMLDMIMPSGMDGFDTFMALKAIKPEINVVIASGYSENSQVRKAQELGAGEFLRKPYSLETLGRALRQTLLLHHN